MPYRYDASLKYRQAAPVGAVDAAPFTDRLAAITTRSGMQKDIAVQAAAQRRLEEEQARAAAQAAKMQAAKDAITQRALASQAKTARLQSDAIAKMGSNMVQARAKIGESAATKTNPVFNQGDGRVVATGKMGVKARDIINEALKYRGRMYQWGGSSPKTSFDCSGLVQWAYKSVGVGLPRISADQARSGRKVSLSALRPGDLVAWDNSSRNNGADHIAIYIGNGQIIEAPHTGAQIRVRKLGNEQNAWGVQIL